MYRRSIVAAAVTAALACGLATGAEIRSSSAAQLRYFHHTGKLRLVNTDRNGGLHGSLWFTTTASPRMVNTSTQRHDGDKRIGRSVTVRINDRGRYATERENRPQPGRRARPRRDRAGTGVAAGQSTLK
jgi:hypothetical protein